MAGEMPAWAQIIVAAVGGGGLTKAADVMFGRKGREVKTLGETIDILSIQQKRFSERLTDVERDLVECHEHHEDCQRGREADRREIDSLKAEIDKLMVGPVAAYTSAQQARLPAPKRRPKG